MSCACSTGKVDPAALRKERVQSAEWKRASAALGTDRGAVVKLDRFTSSAESGRAILQNIDDPKLREKALRDWDREVRRALPSVTKSEHRSSAAAMLQERKLLSEASERATKPVQKIGGKR